MAHRFSAILILFSIAILGLLYFGHSREIKIFQEREKIGLPDGASQEHHSQQKGPRYFKANASRPILKLQAQAVTTTHDLLATSRVPSDMIWQRPQGLWYHHGGEAFHFQAANAKYLPGERKIEMGHGAKIHSAHSRVAADKIYYTAGTDTGGGQGQGHFYAQGNVLGEARNTANGDWVTASAEFAEGWPGQGRFRYWGRVRGKVKRKRVFEQGIHFRANEINLDRKRQLIRMQGNVGLKKQHLSVTARRGEIYLANYNKKLKYYVLSDDVKVVETISRPPPPGDRHHPHRGIRKREAYGEKLEGFVRERKVVLSGSPRVVQEGNVIHGSLITLFEDTEAIQVDDPAAKLLIDEKEWR